MIACVFITPNWMQDLGSIDGIAKQLLLILIGVTESLDHSDMFVGAWEDF